MMDGGSLLGRMSSKREHFDWPLFICAALIGVIGVVNLYSASSVYVDAGAKSGLADIYVSQVYWLVVGVLLAIITTAIDYRHFERLAYFLYGGGIFSLLLIFVLGDSVRGAVRWIKIGSFTFQPSEFMKLLVVLVVARALHDDPKTESRTLFDLIQPFALTALPFALVMMQPDLGTSLIYIFCVISILAITKVRRGSVLTFVAGAGGFAWFAWHNLLRDYQKGRITSFLDPENDKTGTGWHALQSKTAIGNGGLTGQGFMQGTQNQFGFLPDQYSDFPFAVFAEDWGLAGVVLLLTLYGFVSIWSIHIAAQAKDRFGAALAVGVGAIFFWHTIANLGMTLGLLPVVGITLPLFSYGGSSVVTICIAFGLLMNVSMRR